MAMVRRCSLYLWTELDLISLTHSQRSAYGSDNSIIPCLDNIIQEQAPLTTYLPIKPSLQFPDAFKLFLPSIHQSMLGQI